ncbi:MAG: DEAD/DEAH box helicase [Nanoarchaeota archaeon]|nr:DEAD/DEAH box helicase [Nanoarchaeota archaeon]
MNFEELNIRPEIVKALTELGITEATQIQVKSIPIIKEGIDLIGISKTGSGKTAAFGIPLLEKIIPGKGLQAVVLAPTRELAVQISHELAKFGKYLKYRIATVYGGVSLEPQVQELTRAEIMVGTPGRVLDHLNRRTLDVTKVHTFVLDEADKMVDMGFIEDVEVVLKAAPRDRQILLFGATISTEIDKLRQRYMHEPQTVEAEQYVEEDLLKQYYYTVDYRQKFSLLVHLLKTEHRGRAIIFCSARSTVDMVAKNLHKQGIDSEAIHGKLSQSKRLSIISDFNKGKIDLIVASSVAARGLHIDDITHIFNYDLSQDPQEYVHKIGRTARAGKEGKAITLLSERDFQQFSQILNRYRLKVEELPLPEFVRVPFDASRPDSGGFNRRFGHHSRDSHHGGGGRGSSHGGYGGGDSRRDSYGGSRGSSYGSSEGRSSYSSSRPRSREMTRRKD